MAIEAVKDFLSNQIIQSKSGNDAFLLAITASVIFLKENQLGQSVYTQYVEETKCPIDQSGPLPDSEFDPISYKNLPL